LEFDLDLSAFVLLLVLIIDQLLRVELGLLKILSSQFELRLMVLSLDAKFIDISIRKFKSFLVIGSANFLNY
jgi:hypothetical protein